MEDSGAYDGNSIDSKEEEETAFEKGSEAAKSQESNYNSDKEAENSDSENLIHTRVLNRYKHCKGPNVCDTSIMKCSKCVWKNNCEICPACLHEISLGSKHEKQSFRRCYDCAAITKNKKTSEIKYWTA